MRNSNHIQQLVVAAPWFVTTIKLDAAFLAEYFRLPVYTQKWIEDAMIGGVTKPTSHTLMQEPLNVSIEWCIHKWLGLNLY